jgi:O-acetyl-ADP-ribose deacetylase (regulator of RNase III)
MLHFISLNHEWVDEMKKLTFDNSNISCSVQNIRDLDPTNKIFVSPANSLGFMDGGIDYVLSRNMFPGIEPRVKEKIASLGFLTAGGRPYLAIGSATYLPIDHKESGLIVAPTMFLPEDVRKTQNAYHSFYATLSLWEHLGQNKDLVVTSHCCGVGCMSAYDSAEQMFKAYTVWLNKKGVEPIQTSADTLIFPNVDLEQPDVNMNLEVKEVHITKMDTIQRMFRLPQA